MVSNHADVAGYCVLRIPVSDLRRSTDFYCEVLGYGLISANPEKTETAREFF